MDKTELPKGAISFSKTLPDSSTVLLKATKRKAAAVKKADTKEQKNEPEATTTEDE